MRNFGLILISASIFGLSGCFSLECEKSQVSGEEHAVAVNYGWSLFNFIPLFCGNVNGEGRISPWAFFRDDVTTEKIQERFLKEAATNGKQVSELNFHCYNSVMFDLPLLGFTIPIPYVITYKEYQLSGVWK